MRFLVVVCLMLLAMPATAAEPSPVEATKEAQRAELRKLRIHPRGPRGELPDLDQVILDWTEDGHVRAARVASARKAMSGNEAGTTSLEPVQALAQLEKLELVGVAVSDLAPVAGLRQLRDVRISGCLKLRGVAEVTALPALDKLHVEGMPAADLPALATLEHATALALPANDLVDVGFLAGLTQLVHLDLSGNRRLADVRPLAKLTALVVLDLSGTAVKDLAPLADLDGLRVLRVPRRADVRPLAGLKAGGLKIELK